MALAAVKEEGEAATQESEGVYEPEKLAAIHQLGVDPANERFMLLVNDLLRPESLPRGWTASFDASQRKWVYTDKVGALHDKHPVYDYYIGAMFMDLGGYRQLKAIAASRPPTAEEVQQMGQYYGIKPDEDPYIWEVAEMGLCAPLPPGWVEQATQNPSDSSATIAFRQEESGKVQEEHPLDNYFRELIRRRRREMLQRKRAALKSLQALVKMGFGRRSMLAAVAAGARQQEQAEPESGDEPDSLSPETQAALQAAWQDLLGSATQLVHCMQAAAWDGSTGLADPAAAAAGGHGHATNRGTTAVDSELPTAGSLAVAGGSAAATQNRLKQLSVALAMAAGPSPDPVRAAGDALSEIECLAAMAAAAGSNADALAALLAQQGIKLPDYAQASSDMDAEDPASTLDLDLLGPGGRTGNRQSGRQSILGSSGLAAAGGSSVDSRTSGSRNGSRRPSLGAQPSGDVAPDLLQRRNSLLGDAVPFVGSNGATASMAGVSGAASTSGAGWEPWSLAGGKPDEAGKAAAAVARSAAAARAATGGDAAVSVEERAAARFAEAFDAASAGPATPAGTGSSIPSSSAAAGATASAQPDSSTTAPVPANLALVHGVEFPPAADAALQHLAALHGVLQQALSLIKSWQQQKVIIALLQQRLQQAVDNTTRSQRRLALTSHHLRELQAEQGMRMAEATTLSLQCSQLAEQLQEAQHGLSAATEEKQLLQQKLDEALADLAGSNAALERLQAQTGSDAAAAASQASALETARQQMQGTRAQLQAELQMAQAAVTASQEHCKQLEDELAALKSQLEQEQGGKHALVQRLQQNQEELAALQAAGGAGQEHCAQLQQQLAALTSQLEAGQADKQALLLQLQQNKEELAALQAAGGAGQEHCAQLQQQLAALTSQLEAGQADKQALLLQLQQSKEEFAVLQESHKQLQHASGSEAAAAGAELQQLKASLDLLQGSYSTLQAEHTAAVASAAAAQEQQQLLHQQLADTQQQLASLQAEHAALQGNYNQQGQKLSEAEQALKALQDSLKQQGTEFSSAQQQLATLQDTHAATMKQQQLLMEERQQLQAQQGSLQANLSSTQAELAAMQAAAAAAEQKRASMPHKSSQVAATDPAELHWVASRGVQTGVELDDKAKKDASTPADLSLLSYFFREIKQKQRGGGGAILGYDPQEAAHAAAGPASSAKSWSGGTGLPPITGSASGARDGKGASKSAAPTKRPATMPGSLTTKRLDEDEKETGGFSTRPPPWEVRQRVDRRRDKAIKLEAGKAAADGDKWDYAQDERDNEIAELKKRLVEAEHRAKEAAGKAAEELKTLNTELQACKRTLEHAQAENFSLNKDLVALKLAMQAVELADGATAAGQVATGDGHFPGPRSSTFSVAGGPAGRGGAARASTAQSSDAVLEFSGSGARGSVAMLSLSGSGSGQAGGVGMLSPAGRASVVYGAGRLSALPASLSGSPQLPAQSTAGQALKAYAAAPRKSISAPHGSGPGT